MRHLGAAPVAQRHGRASCATARAQGSHCWHAVWFFTALLATLLATTGCCHAATTRQLVAAAAHHHQDMKSQDAADVLGTSLLKDAGWLEERPTSCSNRVCSRYHTQRAQALVCRMLPVPAWWHKAPITAELCHLPGGEVLLTVVTPSDMRAMLYAQLAGPQVVALPITGCSLAAADGSSTDVSHQLWNQNAATSATGGVLALQLLVTDVVPGDYELSVYLTSVSPAYSGKDVKVEGVCGEPLWRLPLHITSAATCTYCGPKPQQWPVCRAPYVEGTVMCASQQEAGMQQPSKPAHSPSGWQNLIRWQPKGCNFMPRQKIDLTTCFIERLVCFVGDAHARNAHEGVVDALVAARVRSTGSKDTTLATIFAHKKSRLVWEASGDLWHAEYSQQLDGCTDVVMALPSGKDASRWQAGNHAFTLTKAFQVMRRLKAAQPSRRFYFMTPPTYAPSCGSASDVKPASSPAVVNELGVMLAGWHHIPVINAAAITAPLITSPDVDSAALNHPYLGFVGQAVTDYVLNVLCVQPQQ